ncbi:uncharacterized protein LOC107424669 [Ziziphus jujuba]|uniref:Uncharacterized protein LOC107424669 n=2 Tax=Ziziphus jujuba TaxID=326968 RepID=A0A6P4A8G5_ZIZJJ|nr:uncharacterized protein LOC107424669 [Ziziphus jujuba]KAH7520004.1 hypothetical protein FEM48_Zijuj08G0097600 [Ziziphus jujuba var. spinosa]
MDTFDFDNVKAEKASAMRKYNRLRSLAKVFRFAELFVALLVLSWTFTRLPFAVKISGEYFRKLLTVIVSPLFVFILCNGIIVSLIAKSGKFSGQNQSANSVEAELYEEITRNSSSSSERTMSESESETQSSATENIVYDDKQIISEVNTTTATQNEVETDTDSNPDSDHPKSYRRTQSEKFNRECSVKNHGELRRSETEKFVNITKSGEDCPPEKLYPQDKLSDDEFNRTVEAFIAKQLRFRRQESLSIVLPNQS